MLEVKLSDEDAKSGAAPEELPELIAAVRECANLRSGLMTMPPWSDDPEAARPYFRRLRELGERHGFRSFRWGCRTISRRPSKKAPPAYAWERRCSASGRRRDGRFLFASAARAHRRGGLLRGAA